MISITDCTALLAEQGVITELKSVDVVVVVLFFLTYKNLC